MSQLAPVVQKMWTTSRLENELKSSCFCFFLVNRSKDALQAFCFGVRIARQRQRHNFKAIPGQPGKKYVVFSINDGQLSQCKQSSKRMEAI